MTGGIILLGMKSDYSGDRSVSPYRTDYAKSTKNRDCRGFEKFTGYTSQRLYRKIAGCCIFSSGVARLMSIVSAMRKCLNTARFTAKTQAATQSLPLCRRLQSAIFYSPLPCFRLRRFSTKANPAKPKTAMAKGKAYQSPYLR